MEIDFLIRQNKKVIPIEVKSGRSRKSASLIKFREKYGKSIGDSIVLHHGELKREDNI